MPLPLAVRTVRRPLQQDLQRKEDVPERTCPRFLLVKLQLDGRFSYLVLDDPNGSASCGFS